ncbi:hypothetical protein JN11_01871 [Mucilaginibacter frigoritolerans]|uniref:Uncharacterized protein n=2 Tax=Mucilaginibacter frigoritolerans TaxID=652788 RepID=A0A562U8C2_9SPHI|nr:hypothetical protein JN11_01871 [Mucilaginibacter frigoritolerans]
MALLQVSYGQNILPDTGFVGLGTTSPVSLLHISSTAAFPLTISTTATTNPTVGFNFMNGNSMPMASIKAYYANGVGSGSSSNQILSLAVPYTNASVNIGNGSVGINTAVPISTLSNIPNTYSGSLGDANGLGIGNSSFTWLNNSGGYAAIFTNSQTGAYTGGLLVKTNSIDPASYITRLESGGFARLAVRSDGYVGIGTASPQANLHLMGTLLSSGPYGNLDPNNPANTLAFLSNSGQMLIGWNRSSGVGETDFIANPGAGTTGGFAFYNHPNTGPETQLMYIMGSGNVLIGKNTQGNSSYLLDVNGTIRGNGVVVNTTGADFVFEPSYHLHSLTYLAKYVGKNHHLPEVESAKQMQTDGLNVGENQTKLLQKVEELTLYLIEKDNEIKKEQQVNQAQQAQINQLREQLNAIAKSLNKSK